MWYDAAMKAVFRLPLTTAMLLSLPLAGVWLAGRPLAPYLQFPPRTHHVEHAPFSWPVFIGFSISILATILPFLIRLFRTSPGPRVTPPTRHFPWWGWMAVGLGSLCWLLAWTRFRWMVPLQPYTFTPQWICYIVAVNALAWRRSGRCLMMRDTRLFLMLFPLSAVFWWFFEYLNRFVQNWFYVGYGPFTSLHYFVAATLSFSTVLPAVLSTEAWLASVPRASTGLDRFLPLARFQTRRSAMFLLAVSAAGLALVGVYPSQLFPLPWLAPLAILSALHMVAGEGPLFPELAEGDWHRVFRLALSALLCGFFWELWNGQSMAKWIYSIPYVDRFHLFEMPLLGYAGYLPFGLECAAIASLLPPRRLSTPACPPADMAIHY